MRFREAVEREGSNVLDDVFLGSCIDSVFRHAAAQLHFQLLHTLPGTPHTDSTPQFLCFCTGKISHSHGHAQELLLKEGNA